MSLAEELVITKLSDTLYSFLPGKAHPYADKAISFEGVAYKMGVAKFWQGGSKTPAIRKLLSQTYTYERNIFWKLILEIVNTSLKYKPQDLYREKIDNVNSLLLELQIKIPELNDIRFLKALPSKQIDKNDGSKSINIDAERKRLCNDLMELSKLNDSPQTRGFKFEKFLTDLFSVFGLKPRKSFKLVGEQIDGSIELDHEIYLIEAKWCNSQISANELDSFSLKVGRKSDWTRGLFISFSGFTEEGITAFEKGNVNLITMTGQDLYFILVGDNNKYINLIDCLRFKFRYTAETGSIFYPVQNIIKAKGL